MRRLRPKRVMQLSLPKLREWEDQNAAGLARLIKMLGAGELDCQRRAQHRKKRLEKWNSRQYFLTTLPITDGDLLRLLE